MKIFKISQKYILTILLGLLLIMGTSLKNLNLLFSNDHLNSSSQVIDTSGNQPNPQTSITTYPKNNHPLAYAVLEKSCSILPVDLETGILYPQIPVEFKPHLLAVSSQGNKLYIANENAQAIFIVDLYTKAVTPLVELNETIDKSTLSKDEKNLYFSSKDSPQIFSLNLTNLETTPLFCLDQAASSLVMGSHDRSLYVSYENSHDIEELDLASKEVKPFISLPSPAVKMSLSSLKKELFLTQSVSPRHLSFQCEEDIFTEISTFSAHDPMLTLGVNHDATKLFLSNEETNEVVALDLKTKEIETLFQFEEPLSSLIFLPAIETRVEIDVEPQVSGEPTYFKANTTKISESEKVCYEWNFGDGLSAISTSAEMFHVYEHPGDYKAHVSVFHRFQNPHQLEEELSFIQIVSRSEVDLDILENFHFNKYEMGIGGPISPLGGAIPSTTVATPSQSTIIYGGSVTDIAVVTGTPEGGTPTGTITFYLNSVQLGSPVTLVAGANNSATATSIPYTPSSVGSFQFDAQYSGDVNYTLSSDSSETNAFSVVQASSSTNLLTSVNPSYFGQSVTFTANVTLANNINDLATGTVSFFDGATQIGSPITLVSGSAIISTSSLSVGSHNITAVYNGDVNFAGSTSNSLIQTVNIATTNTALSSSVNPSIFGNATVLTATVSVTNGAGTPTGTVNFIDGGVTIGTGTLVGNVATLTTSSLGMGTHSLTATYIATPNFSTSTSSVVTQVVTQGTTNTALTSSVNPTTYGASTTFTATLSVATGAGTPTGNVTFKIDGASVSTVALSGLTATFSTANLSVGSHSIVATYNGDTNFSLSNSATLTQVVQKATPTVTLTSSTNPSNYGQTITLTSVVTSPTSLGLPGGTVTFFDNGVPLPSPVTLSPTTSNSATATLTVNTLSGGTHNLTATYNGDTSFNVDTSPTVAQNVILANTVTTLFSTSPNATAFGESVVLQANVVGAVSAPPLAPGGTVIFFDGATQIGTGTLTMLSPNTGFASFNANALAIGTHTLSAVYQGDINYNGSTSNNLNHIIIAAGTTTATTSSVNPSVFGQTVTFTATVTASLPGMGQPTGVVRFYDGINFLGTGTLAPLTVNSSSATFSTSGLSLGKHNIQVIYDGDGSFTVSSAPNFVQTVIKDNSTTTITSSLNPSTFGTNITLSATITANAPGSGTPTGTVTFSEGATVLGTFPVVGGVAMYSTIAFYPGAHTITATYSGDTNFNISNGTFVQTVTNQLNTTTTITSSRDSSPVNAAITFSAKVAAITGTPTGTVQFLLNGNPIVPTSSATLNSSGVASLTIAGTNFALVGTDVITATYVGDANFITSANSYTQHIVPYNTVTVLTSAENPSQQANDVLTATITASGTPTPIPPFTGTVSFYEGTTFLGGPFAVPPSGVVTFAPNNYHFNSVGVFAVYSGDPNLFATSTSNTLNLQVQQTDMLTTATTLTSSSPTSFFCQSIDLTATVVNTQGFYLPTGTVTFFDGSVALGTGYLDSTGKAVLSVSTLTAGTHQLKATYNSDSNYAFSVSSNITQTVVSNPTTLSLSIIPNLASTPYGQELNFVAIVSSSFGTPTGSVVFTDDSTGIILEEIDLDATGTATYTTSNMEAGTHTITATYDPSCCGVANACFLASTNSLSHIVTKANSNAFLTSTPSPSVYGDEVSITANIASFGIGTPSGTVTFYNGSTFLGTAAISEGIATIDVDNLPAGIRIFNATYSGDDNFVSKNFPSKQQIINKAPVAISLTSFSPNPSVFGQLVTFNATITSNISIPTGTVTFFNGSSQLGQVTLNGSGEATLEVSSLLLGSNSITVVYSGDSNFLNGTSSAYIQTVTKSPTITTVTSTTPNPSTFNSTVSVVVNVAAVNPATGTPTGTVTGFYGSVNLGTATLSGGNATFTSAVLPVGTPTITVVYNGDTNFNTSTGFKSQTVNAATTTVSTLTSSVNPSVFGQAVTFNVKLASTAGNPSGFVTFLDGTTQLGVATLDSTGNAAITVSNLSVATHPITVRYNGNGNFGAVLSSTLNQVVNKAATTTTLVTTAGNSFFGEPISFTATVSPTAPGSGNPTGTVTFRNGATILSTLQLSNGGIVTFTTSSLQASAVPYTITATYSGDTNFTTSVSNNVSETVNPVSTVMTVTSSQNPSALGQLVTFNVTVNPINTGLVTPTGNVTATYGSTVIGTGALDSNGRVSFSTSSLPAGNLPIIFSYAGNSNFSPSSTTLTQTVTELASTTTLTSSLNPSHVGEAVTFSATVTSSLAIPTGTVAFFDGASIIAIQSMNGSGVATLTVSNLTLGNHSIKAIYSGDSNYNSSTSALLNQSVIQATTTTDVSSSVNPSFFGQSTNFIATVTPLIGAGNPTGTVTFKEGATILGTSPVSGGQAILAYALLVPGSHTITATYNGDTNFVGSNNTVSQVVTKATTSTTLNSSVNPTTFGQSTTLSAIVAVTAGGGNPSGTVNFLDGATFLGSAPGVNGVATLTISTLSVGSHNIVANYSGDTNFGLSQGTLSQVVQVATSTTQLTSLPNPSFYGQNVLLTATVPTGSGSTTPTGTITFKDAGVNIGLPVTLVGGVATLNISNLSQGSHSLTATYSGDANHSGSVSPLVVQVVNQATTSTVVTSSLDPSVFGTNVTFTATVTDLVGTGTPTGTIVFTDGATVLGNAPLVGGVASISTSTLSVGNHSITGRYIGDVNYITSTSVQITQTVTLAPTTTILSSSGTPSTFGQPVTFTANVSSTQGTPTGTITFVDGSTTIGTATISGGTATLTVSNLAVGAHSITAIYNGDVSFNTSTSSPILVQTVNKSVSTTNILATTPNPSLLGQTVTFFATVSTPTGQPTGTVTFLDGGVAISGPSTVTVHDGLAIFSTSILSLGNHQITASYSGDANFLPSLSTPPIVQVVNQNNATVTSTLTLTSSLNPSDYGDSVTFDITVTPLTGVGITPTGTVTLYSGAIPLTMGLFLDASGHTSFTTTTLPAGTETIVALYSGDSVYSASTDTLAQVVNPVATTTTLSSSVNPSTYHQEVIYTAQVNWTTGLVTAGTVSFYEDGVLIGTSTVNSSGIANITYNQLPTGLHLIGAIYNPQANFAASSDSLTQIVTTSPTFSMVLTSTPNPSTQGQSVTFVASVSSPYGVPTGSIEFFDNGVSIGTPAIFNGMAIFNTSVLAPGTHAITIVYSGDSNFDPSTSAPYTQIVENPAFGTTTTLTSSLNPAMLGVPVTFSSMVTSPSGIPTGSVTFFDNGMSLGTSILTGGSAQLTTSSLSLGNHVITAVYNGDADFAVSTSLPLTEMIINTDVPSVPQSFYGCRVVNKFVNSKEHVNVLTWNPPQNNADIDHYEIYRDAGLTDLIGSVTSHCDYRFEDKNIRKHKTYTYYLVAVTTIGVKSPAISTTVAPNKKH